MSSPLKILVAQINPIVGDLEGNVKKLLEAVAHARETGDSLVVTSELALCGYPPKDLLLREQFVHDCDHAVEQLAAQLPEGIGLLVGHPTARNVPQGQIANAASLLFDGKVQQTIHKRLLPNYDVFDERRYFHPAESQPLMEFQGHKLGVHICEDAWFGQPKTFYHASKCEDRDPVAELAAQKPDLFVNLSASPFEVGKLQRRIEIVQAHVKRHGIPYLFVNQVGGNDDLVFDGGSFEVDAKGEILQRWPQWFAWPYRELSQVTKPNGEIDAPRAHQILQALILGLKDYGQKCGFTDCVIGLSGGIDSALACYIAARAFGPEHVHGILMPSRYSSEHSVSDAKALAEALGIDWAIIPIDSVHQSYEGLPVLGEELLNAQAGLADQNLQARIRGAIVMTRSNRNGWIALATGNKSEIAVGYCTLYGDMCGGFAVLSDLLKRDVYAVSRHINEVVEQQEIIPWSTINKAPSAELAPNQVDQDSLPAYEVLDAILDGLINEERSEASLVEEFPEETVRWVARALDRYEFKRRQLPPGIKLSPRAFGSGRRMPMAARQTQVSHKSSLTE